MIRQVLGFRPLAVILAEALCEQVYEGWALRKQVCLQLLSRALILQIMIQRALPLRHLHADDDIVIYFEERPLARYQLEYDAPEGPNIVLEGQFAVELLRWHVTKSAAAGAFAATGVLELARHAEIDQFDNIALRIKQYVSWLEILVDDFAIVVQVY